MKATNPTNHTNWSPNVFFITITRAVLLSDFIEYSPVPITEIAIPI